MGTFSHDGGESVALPLAQALTLVQVPQGFADLIRSITDDPNLTILLMLGVFILAGCVMEATPNIVSLAPIICGWAVELREALIGVE